MVFLSLVIRSVEIYRENQVEIAVFIIPDETWCLRIEQIDVQFLVVDDTDGIHQQSRVEADQDGLTSEEAEALKQNLSKAENERDVYKNMYNELLAKVLNWKST